MAERTSEQEIKEIWELIREREKGFEQLRQEFKEIRELFKDTDRRFKETDRRFKETDGRFKETDGRFKETDGRFKETDGRFKETDRQRKETGEQIKELSKLFTGQWGKLIEALVEPGALKLFRDRNIHVSEVQRRVERMYNGSKIEVDLLLTNDHDLVVIEVKTTLQVEDVRDFLERLRNFLTFFPRYRTYTIYGAVAALQIEEESDRFAYKQGLFVLKAGKENMITMLNDLKFRPKNFGIEQSTGTS